MLPGAGRERIHSEFHGSSLRWSPLHQERRVILLREATDCLQTKYPKLATDISINFRDGKVRRGKATSVSSSLEIPAWPLTVDPNTALRTPVSSGSPFSFVCQVREEGTPVHIT